MLRASLLRSALVATSIVGIFVACSSEPGKAKTACTPNKGSYCRCRDRNQGEKTCKPDGSGFGPCEPCETFDNPEGPLLPGDPGYGGGDDDDIDFPTVDGGEQPEDSGQPVEKAVCGNDKAEQGEDCDGTDGCTDCKIVGTPDSSASCPGLAVHVWGGLHKPSITLSTAGSGKRKSKDLCTASGSTATDGSGASDRVFRVTAHKQGSLTVRVTDTTFNAYAYVSAACDASMTATKCVNKVNQIGDETVIVGATPDTSYTVVVDGAASGAEGSFKVTFSID
jgi:hypothetical protein